MRPRAKPKTPEKPAAPRKATVARLVAPSPRDIDDDADDRQRVGVQSLGRAFAILEEVARHREGIGLADLSKLVSLHNSTTFHLAKTMVVRAEEETAAPATSQNFDRSASSVSTRNADESPSSARA